MSPTRIGIAGAGRMGMAIADLVATADDLQISGIWTRRPDAVDHSAVEPSAYVGNDLGALLELSDVLIDFSLPAGTAQLVGAAAKSGVPLVSGVSGLDDEQLSGLRAASGRIPIVYDRNMSQGVAVLARLVADASRALGEEFAVRIDETHHVHKKDAPSGTALKLGEAVAAARDNDFSAARHYDENRKPAPGQIEFIVRREADIPGDHAVSFSSDSEVLTLSHSVRSRDVFARGAVAAARWVLGREAGLYSMSDVLSGK